MHARALFALRDVVPFVASYVDDLLPLVVGALLLAGFARVATLDRELLARAALGAVGSAFVAYGLREVLRAWGGGYYCCNQGVYATIGLAVAAVGWVLVVSSLRGRVVGPG